MLEFFKYIYSLFASKYQPTSLIRLYPSIFMQFYVLHDVLEESLSGARREARRITYWYVTARHKIECERPSATGLRHLGTQLHDKKVSQNPL